MIPSPKWWDNVPKPGRTSDPTAYKWDGVTTTLATAIPADVALSAKDIVLADASDFPRGGGDEVEAIILDATNLLNVKEVVYNWSTVSGNTLPAASRVYGTACEVGDIVHIGQSARAFRKVLEVLETLEYGTRQDTFDINDIAFKRLANNIMHIEGAGISKTEIELRLGFLRFIERGYVLMKTTASDQMDFRNNDDNDFVPIRAKTPDGNDGNELATVDYVMALANGIKWQQPVESLGDTTPPGAPSDGDRYVVGAGATGAWSGQDDDIAVWDDYASQWNFISATEGMGLWVKDVNKYYVFNGTSWVQFGAVVDHENLTNIGTLTHAQLETAISDLTDALDAYVDDLMEMIVARAPWSGSFSEHEIASYEWNTTLERYDFQPTGISKAQLLAAVAAAADVADTIIVDAAGGGDYTSIRTAFETEQGNKKYKIRAGTYVETDTINFFDGMVIEWERGADNSGVIIDFDGSTLGFGAGNGGNSTTAEWTVGGNFSSGTTFIVAGKDLTDEEAHPENYKVYVGGREHQMVSAVHATQTITITPAVQKPVAGAVSHVQWMTSPCRNVKMSGKLTVQNNSDTNCAFFRFYNLDLRDFEIDAPGAGLYNCVSVKGGSFNRTDYDYGAASAHKYIFYAERSQHLFGQEFTVLQCYANTANNLYALSIGNNSLDCCDIFVNIQNNTNLGAGTFYGISTSGGGTNIQNNCIIRGINATNDIDWSGLRGNFDVDNVVP